MGKFKVGDEVVLSQEGIGQYSHVKQGQVMKVTRVDRSGDPWTDGVGMSFETCFNEDWLTYPNTIQLHQPYTSKNGTKWMCIAVNSGLAWLAAKDGECATGTAYVFKLDGTNISQGGGMWDIQWEPVVEWIDYVADLVPYGPRVTVKYPLIDGKPDFTQATVTPASDG